DVSYAQQRPHGNVKKTENASSFHRTKPSVLNNIKEVVQHNTGSKVYKDIISTSEFESICPRNVKQTNNLRHLFLNKNRLTNDEILNVIQLSFELNDFIRVASFPNVAIVLIHKESEDIFKNLLEATSEYIQLFYDTTFKIGSYYLSILISDHESSFIKAFTQTFPNLKLARCGLHYSKDLRTWLKADFKKHFDPTVHNGYNPPYDDEPQLLLSERVQRARNSHIDHHQNSVSELLASETEAEFQSILKRIKPTWTQSFQRYFEKNHLNNIEQLANAPPTSNAAESMNSAIKKYLHFKQQSMDRFVTNTYPFMGYYVTEIHRGYCQLGSYKLKSEYHHLAADPNILTVNKTYNIDDVLVQIKEHLMKEKKNQTNVHSRSLFTFNMFESNEDDIEDIDETSDNSSLTTTAASTSSVNQPNSTVVKHSMTTEEKAKMIISQRLVSFDEEAKVFNVQSLDRTNCYSVHYHDPKVLPKCSCNNRAQNCSHVATVKLVMGTPLSDRDRQINLGTIRKRKRQQDKEGGSGNKCPNRVDRAVAKQYKAEALNKRTSPYFDNDSNTTNHSTPSPSFRVNPVATNLLNAPTTTQTLRFIAPKRPPLQNIQKMTFHFILQAPMKTKKDLINHLNDYVQNVPHQWAQIHGTSPNQIHQQKLLDFYNSCVKNKQFGRKYYPRSGNYIYRFERSNKSGEMCFVVDQFVKQTGRHAKTTDYHEKMTRRVFLRDQLVKLMVDYYIVEGIKTGRAPSNNSFDRKYKENNWIVREKVNPVFDYMYQLIRFERDGESSSDEEEKENADSRKDKSTPNVVVTTAQQGPAAVSATVLAVVTSTTPTAALNRELRRSTDEGGSCSAAKKTKKDKSDQPLETRTTTVKQHSDPGRTAASALAQDMTPETFKRELRPRKK
ncbi:unnamed protein product, partial [Didymodactylos carnosus]